MQLEWLARIRGELTQDEAAKKAGISRSAYANIESGNRAPSVDAAKKIAAGLEFSKFELDWTIFFDLERFESKLLREVI
ncbi:helix-turn-helix transcriptional regulator [Cohnella sp. JJ-181]|uniref:helix-turn-helix transcriptional regulator n=1 Tax=Cohnella rhizoplanae TaxID=2974897 RepID=UPI0022FF8C6A|nr:helix-turn-helix transcriptional regulator [Cohnella sp. JJ-181]CAI6072662.1 hypothetical protein COHCIP112018_02355 [Cohnella sp. JJ-181]